LNTARLHEIINETTSEFRKGRVVERERVGDVDVVQVYGMPHVEEAGAEVERVDVHFIVVGVDVEAARARESDLKQILSEYPNPGRLAGGPSYIELGAEIGSQGAALRLFALGKVLGLWSVITPESFGMLGEEAARAAGAGYVMCTGWKPAVPESE
jgi:hypothetical protein